MNDFTRCAEIVLNIEGEYVYNPKDPGGETKYGISKRAFPDEDIKNLTKERALELYKLRYWNICQCDKMPLYLALLVFDMAVNSGSSAAIKILQQSLNILADGVMGPITINCIKAVYHHEILIYQYLFNRAVYCLRVADRRNLLEHAAGWANRMQLKILPAALRFLI